MRDPRTDPREGDELLQVGGGKMLCVDIVTDGEVYYRVVYGTALISMARRSVESFCEMAIQQCRDPKPEMKEER